MSREGAAGGFQSAADAHSDKRESKGFRADMRECQGITAGSGITRKNKIGGHVCHEEQIFIRC